MIPTGVEGGALQGLRPRPAVWEALSLLALALASFHFLGLVGTWPEAGVMRYQPHPDAVEFAWVTHAFAEGHNPLMPIGNELHPSRYAPVHPFVASLWVRAHGWSRTVLRDYSRWACVGAGLLLYLWLRALAVAPWSCSMAVAAVLFTSPVVWAGRNILQEPTMLLLFAAGGLSWALASRRLERAPRSPLGLAALGACAALWAGVVAMRPTGAPLLLIPAVEIVASVGRRRAMAAAVAWSVGAVGMIASVMTHSWRMTGAPRLTSYEHWSPGFIGEYFSLGNPLATPHGSEGVPHLVQAALAWIGWSGDFTEATLLCPFLAVVGADLVLRRGRSGAARTAGLLLLFVLSQAVILVFYRFFTPRFYTIAFPALLIAGVIGWDAATRSLWRRGGVWRPASVAVFAAAAVGLTGLWRPPPEVGELAHPNAVSLTRRMEAMGRLVRRLDCPLFLDRLPVLNARLHWDLAEWPHPIAPLIVNLDLHVDGHLPQFKIEEVGPARGHLDDPTLWPHDPLQDHLVDYRGEVFEDGRIERLVERHGRIAIFGPRWRNDAVDVLAAWADRSGFAMREEGQSTDWRLLIIEPGGDTR